jgi:hypothetical protein
MQLHMPHEQVEICTIDLPDHHAMIPTPDGDGWR